MNNQDLQQFKELLLASNQSIIKAIQEHNVPSQDTKIFMEKQQLINIGIEKELNELKSIVATKQDVILAVEEALKNFRKDCEEKYASKNTEKVLRWIGVAVGVGVLGVIGSIILSYFKL